MNIIGHTLNHRTFGCGVITALENSIMSVRFNGIEKKFVYPDAFMNHLSFQDKLQQQKIIDQLAVKNYELKQTRQNEQKVRELMWKLNNFTVSPNAHAVFNILPSQAENTCRSFCVSTGHHLSGRSRGQFRIADKLKPNSACLLTRKPKGSPEQAREIIGAFMVKADFFGEDACDGIVEAHPRYRIVLSEDDPMPFWKHFPQGTTQRWGNTAFKYFHVSIIHLILYEMLQKLANTDQYESALSLYEYFCDINQLESITKTNTTPGSK